jgi:predicted RNA binding protein YcfA (HicA-like mRNA interferase family)
MPRRLGSAEIIRVLEANGFTFISQRGSHVKYRNAPGRTAIVPHPKREIPIGTTRSIIRQSGLTPKDFGF